MPIVSNVTYPGTHVIISDNDVSGELEKESADEDEDEDVGEHTSQEVAGDEANKDKVVCC